MKVCILKYDFNVMGGAENVAIKLANELANFYDIHLVSIVSNLDSESFGLSEKVKYKNFLTGKSQIKDTLFKGSSAFRQYAKEEGFDVILSIGLPSNIFALSGKLRRNTRIIFCEHTHAKYMPTKLSSVHRKLGVLFFDKIITPTEKDRENYMSIFGLKEDSVEAIPNWFDSLEIETFYNADSKKLVTAGRFCDQKGYDYLVEVARLFFEKKPEWSWDLYGQEDDVVYPETMKKIREYGLEENIIYKGVSYNKDDIYKDASVYVMTSRAEGLPLVLLEALSYKLPLVSFNCLTGPSDIINEGENGFLVENFDVETMAKKLIELAENKELRMTMSNNSLESLKKFKKIEIINKWRNLIENI